MTQPAEITRTVVARVRDIRKLRRLTAEQLALRCQALGSPALNRSVLANLESGRRAYLTVDEAFVLAEALEVRAADLLAPPTVTMQVETSIRFDSPHAGRHIVSPSRKVKTDAMLQEVARVYRDNVGDRPTQAVAAHFGKAHRTAGLYVKWAREAGHLGATTQGRAGEFTTRSDTSA